MIGDKIQEEEDSNDSDGPQNVYSSNNTVGECM